MFQRRLAIIFALGLAGCLVMMVQILRLAVADGSLNRAEAEVDTPWLLNREGTTITVFNC